MDQQSILDCVRQAIPQKKVGLSDKVVEYLRGLKKETEDRRWGLHG